MKEVGLGVCRGHYFDGDPTRTVVLLPGAGHTVFAPLLWFAREVAQAQGWAVLQVSDSWDRSVEAEQWVEDRLYAALAYVGDVANLILITKSLSSLALPAAVERGIAGVWLTPLLGQDSVRAALPAVQTPRLVVGATADPTRDSQFVSGLANVDVVEIEGSDHMLQHAYDVDESLEYLRRVTDSIDDFIAGLC
jgi:hypothetical protein